MAPLLLGVAVGSRSSPLTFVHFQDDMGRNMLVLLGLASFPLGRSAFRACPHAQQIILVFHASRSCVRNFVGELPPHPTVATPPPPRKKSALAPAGQPGPSGTEAMPRLLVVSIALRVFHCQVRMRGEWFSPRPWVRDLAPAHGRGQCCFGTPLAAIAQARCLATPFPLNGGPQRGLGGLRGRHRAQGSVALEGKLGISLRASSFL